MATRGINKVILIGNLGGNPEMRYSPGGDAIAKVSIATSESWKDKNTGQMNELTEWHNVTFFGKLADIVGQYLIKGSQIYVEGKLKTDKYQDKQSGQDRYSTGIVVDGFSGVLQMLGGNPSGGQGNGASGGQNQNNHTQNSQQQQSRPQQQSSNQNQQYDRQTNRAVEQNQARQQQGNQQQSGEFDNSFDDTIPF